MLTDKDLNLFTLSPLFSDETKAREFLESRLWPNGPVCPHCDSKEVYTLTPKPGSKSPVRAGVYKCKKCRKQFTVRIGTIFEESKVPLCKWLMAIHLMTSSKKGVSARQIQRELGVTVQTAWFLCHRIREAMKPASREELSGEVEADETYVGGKPRHPWKKREAWTTKKPVMLLVERDGRARTKPLDIVDGRTLKGEIVDNVSPEATIMTDELQQYKGVGEKFAGGHKTCCHSWKEYVRLEPNGQKVHTNTAESYFALLKRGHYGIFHHLSRKHLHRYCVEFDFRWNHRKVTDGERMVAAIKGAEGKRLMYRASLRHA